MRVEIVRRGGIAGVALHGSLDTSELPPATRGSIEQALLHLPFDSASAEPPHPESFRYDIAVDDDSGRRTAQFDESQIPDALVSAIKNVLKLPGSP